jgi:hypothetical protein
MFFLLLLLVAVAVFPSFLLKDIQLQKVHLYRIYTIEKRGCP